MAYNAGEKITAGELSALLTAIKNEFARRKNPYTTSRLDSYGSSLSLPTADA